MHRLEKLSSSMSPTSGMHHPRPADLVICRISVCLENTFELSQKLPRPIASATQPKVEHNASSGAAVLPEIRLVVQQLAHFEDPAVQRRSADFQANARYCSISGAQFLAGQRSSIAFMSSSAHRTASAIALRVAGTLFPPSNCASLRAARMLAAINNTRLRPSFASAIREKKNKPETPVGKLSLRYGLVSTVSV